MTERLYPYSTLFGKLNIELKNLIVKNKYGVPKELPDIDFELETKTIPEIVDQISSEDREGSLSDFTGRNNYLNHVQGHPTKSLSEAIASLYEVIDSLNGYVSGGVADEDIRFARSIHEKLVRKNILGQDSQWKFDLMLNRVDQKRNSKEVPEGSGLCFVISPDNRQFAVTDVPQRTESDW